MHIKTYSNSELLLYLFSISSVFYLAKITTFSPIYVFQPILIFFSVCLIIKNKIIHIDKISIILIIIFLLSFYNTILLSEKYSTFTNLAIAIFSSISIINLPNLNTNIIINIISKSINLIIIILLIDTFFRLIHPDHSRYEFIEEMQDSFYIYKFGTYMFADSNTVALVCIPIIFFLKYLFYEHKINLKKQSIILLFILFSTFSRSAIIAYLLSSILFTKKFSTTAKLNLFSILLPFVIFFVYKFTITDDSGETKFYILQSFIKYLNNSSWITILFGSGLDNSQIALNGIYGHIFFVTAIVEFGVIGIFILLTLYITLILKTNYKAIYILLPIFITSCSYYFYLGSPFSILPIIYIYMIENTHNEK